MLGFFIKNGFFFKCIDVFRFMLQLFGSRFPNFRILGVSFIEEVFMHCIALDSEALNFLMLKMMQF